MSKRKSYIVLDGERDRHGRVPFTMYWYDPDGVFRSELSKDDGLPVGYRRGQCFRTQPEQHVKRGAVIVDTHEEAKRRAWRERSTVAADDVTHLRNGRRCGVLLDVTSRLAEATNVKHVECNKCHERFALKIGANDEAC